MRTCADSAQIIIISRFILNIRRSDQKNRTVESNLSHFATSQASIQIWSLEHVVSEMGQPLDHGFEEAEEQQENFPDDAQEPCSPGIQ